MLPARYPTSADEALRDRLRDGGVHRERAAHGRRGGLGPTGPDDANRILSLLAPRTDLSWCALHTIEVPTIGDPFQLVLAGVFELKS